MSLRQSFQLPDLLIFIASLELRTNPHCRITTEASEKWIISKNNELQLLSDNDLQILRPTKLGLLASLCFPTCDAPQLRLLIDFMNLLLYSGIRMHTAPDSACGLWDAPLKVQAGDIHGSQSGVDILRRHILLKHALDTRISTLSDRAPDTWKARFRRSVEQFYSVHAQISSNRSQNHIPSLDEYIQIRREMHGFSLTFDLAELLEIFTFPEVEDSGTAVLANIKGAALDVMAWSTDVAAYQLDQSRGNDHCNLVALLMFHKNLSLQGAMNLAGNMIKDAFASFCSHEKDLLEALNAQKSGAQIPLLSWVWKSLSSHNTSQVEDNATQFEDVKRYIRALKDCIAGQIHWMYETELFFGKKGSEIRKFGWVFVDQVSTSTVPN